MHCLWRCGSWCAMQGVVEQLRATELLGANATVFVCDASVLDSVVCN
jgi:hypothetical protein